MILNNNQYPDDFSKKYQAYFTEIRPKLIKTIIAFAIGTFFGVLLNQKIIIFTLKFFNFKGISLIMTSPTQFIELAVYTGILIGFIFALPFLIWQVLFFIKPALKKEEWQLIVKFLPLSFLLFLVGFFLGGWLMQFIITLYSQIADIFKTDNLWDIQKLLIQTLTLAILIGLIFEMPVVLTLLIKIKLIKKDFLVAKRKEAYALLLIFAMILPPTDPLSLVILTLPLLFLYELTLLLNKGSN